MAYQMAAIPMTLSDLQGHFCCLKHFQLPYLGNLANAYIIYDMFIHVLQAFLNVIFRCEAVDIILNDIGHCTVRL